MNYLGYYDHNPSILINIDTLKPTFANTFFTQGLRPLCFPCATTKLARSPLKAQRRPKGCLGRSRVAQRMFSIMFSALMHGCKFDTLHTWPLLSVSFNTSRSILMGGPFADHIFELIFMNSISAILVLRINWQQISVDSDYELVPNRQQVIFWTDYD